MLHNTINSHLLFFAFSNTYQQNERNTMAASAEVRIAFENYIKAYFAERNMKKTFAFFSDDFTVIGTGVDEIAMRRGEFKTFYLRDIEKAQNSVDVTLQDCTVLEISVTVALLHAVINIKTHIDEKLFEAEGLRVSVVYRQEEGKWMMVHLHISIPTVIHEDEASYPVQELEKRNRWLEEKINEKTLEFNTKNQELSDALKQVKKLGGLLPICASCKKIRNDKGYWQIVEEYISDHSEAEFSHGICPDCAAKLYPKFIARRKEKQ